MHLTRRSALALPLLGLLPAAARPGLDATIAAVEAATGGRVGLAVHNLGNGARFVHNGGSRFAMCSTFKLLLAAHVLAQVDRGRLRLDEAIPVTKADLLSNAPFTEKRVGGEAPTIFELAESAVTLSDNPAANLLLARTGGPAGLTAFLRRTGDRVTRLDRLELELNTAIPGDPRDTTTPDAVLATLHRLTETAVLSPASRRQLIAWMDACQTGNAMVRSVLPSGWQEGNKTGAGDNGTRNILSRIQPPGRPPILYVAFLTGARGSLAEHNRHHASIARAALAAFAA